MATNPEVKTNILQGMEELHTITGMINKLKTDLKQKETLLKKMENALSKAEQRLEKKVAEIDDKDKRLSDVENKLLKRQEELGIQEKDVQTNAILQFLSFQAREMEIQKRLDTAPDPDKTDKMTGEIEKFRKQIEEKNREIEDLKLTIKTHEETPAVVGVGPDQKEIKKMKQSLDNMRENLTRKEMDLLKKDEELRTREQKMSSGSGEMDKKALEALTERENELKSLEEQLRNRQKEISHFVNGLETKESRIQELENDLKFKEELLRMKEEEEKNIQASGGNSADIKTLKENLDKEYMTKISMMESNYKNKIDSLKSKLDTLMTRNEELEVLGDQLSAEKLRVTLLERELRERMNEINFSEERLARRQELMLKERKQIDEQIKKLKETQDGSNASGLNEELVNRNKQLREIEGKLREKEEYLRKRERDLRGLESQMVDQEIMLESEVESDQNLNRVRSGIRRFDDLCYGGFPYNSNFIIYGPAYSGRRTFSNLFISEGLKKGVPTIFITTQHTPAEIKDQLRVIIPKVDIYEEKGLLKYIDLYSKTMGISEEYPNTIYVDKPTNLEAIEAAIGEYQEQFLEKKTPYHKLVFNSLSTLLTYIEPLNLFRFFQVLNAKNKRNGAVSMYVVDTGMHDPSVIQTLKHVMTGFIEFKLDDLKYYLRMEGGGDVMSRAWIEFSFTDKTFDLRGSFSLDHIR